MKKVMLLVVLAVLILGGSLFAQQNSPRLSHESEYYFFTVPIETIYTHRLGFVVLYRKGLNQMARTYIPHEWFSGMGGKGEIIGLGSGDEWPSLTVYHKGGEFSHVRLRLRQNRSHQTWSTVPQNVNIDENFTNVEEIKLEF